MTLRTKTLSIIGIVLTVLIGSIYLITARLLSDSFLRLEKTTVERNVNRVKEAINDEVASVEGFTGDYSDWDETVKFVQEPNQEYIDSNLAGVTFENLKINDFVFVNKAGEVVWGSKYNLESGEFLPLHDDLLAQIKPGSPLLDRKDHDDTLSGLFMQKDHPPTILVSRPLMNSEGEGDVFGTVIVTRDLDANRIEKISKQTHLEFSFQRFENPNLPADFSNAKANLSDAQTIFVNPESKDNAAGYAKINDLYGEPSLLLKVNVPREVVAQGLKTTKYFLYILVGLGFVFLMVALILLSRLVLNRLAKLSHDVTKIGSSSDFAARVNIKGNDELGGLSTTINWMLGALQQSQNELQTEKSSVEAKVKERTRELAAEQGKMAMVLAGMTDSVIAIDTAGKIITLNQNARDIIGSKEEIIGRSLPEVLKLYDDQRQLSLDEFAPLKSNFAGVTYENKTVRLQGIGGKVVYARFSASQIHRGADVNLRAILTIHDTTAEKQLETMKLDFVTMAAHELRTPIAVIKGYLELLVRQKNMDKTNEEYLQKSLANTFSLIGLVNNLLNVSKIERKSLTFTPTPLDLVVVINIAMNDQKINAEQGEVTLAFDSPNTSAVVLGDELMLKEVMNNLLSNAVHYTPANGKINISLKMDDKTVTVSVQDTGVGIPVSSLPKLFTKFYRVHGGLESGSKGTGLGLYITKSIVELHGGKVGVNSVEGKGSTFYFSLPLTDKGIVDDTTASTNVKKKLNYGWLSKDITN